MVTSGSQNDSSQFVLQMIFEPSHKGHADTSLGVENNLNDRWPQGPLWSWSSYALTLEMMYFRQ